MIEKNYLGFKYVAYIVSDKILFADASVEFVLRNHLLKRKKNILKKDWNILIKISI